MPTAIPKLSAMAGAACLLATMALPAHASPLPRPAADAVAAPAAVAATPPPQTLAVGAAVEAAAGAKGAALVSTLIPVPVAPVVETMVEADAPSAADGTDTTTAAVPAIVPAPVSPTQSGSAVLDYAAQFVGVVPYGMGNTPDTSFSCDGFVQYVFSSFGYSLPRGADHQAAMGTPISRAEAVAGDLVWWPGQHIGIYDGAGGMYDSPNWGRFVQHPAQLWGSPSFIRLG